MKILIIEDNKSLISTLKDVLESSGYELEEEIDISKQIENYKIVILANTLNINECMIHLLNNAYEHRKDMIKVEIKAKDKLKISVIDDKSGFDEVILKESKDLFVTNNIAKTAGKGYGIGLYYVNTYIERISGKLELMNIANGAIAKILIPLEDLDD